MQMHEFPGFIHTISHWAVSKKKPWKNTTHSLKVYIIFV